MIKKLFFIFTSILVLESSLLSVYAPITNAADPCIDPINPQIISSSNISVTPSNPDTSDTISIAVNNAPSLMRNKTLYIFIDAQGTPPRSSYGPFSISLNALGNGTGTISPQILPAGGHSGLIYVMPDPPIITPGDYRGIPCSDIFNFQVTAAGPVLPPAACGSVSITTPPPYVTFSPIDFKVEGATEFQSKTIAMGIFLKSSGQKVITKNITLNTSGDGSAQLSFTGGDYIALLYKDELSVPDRIGDIPSCSVNQVEFSVMDQQFCGNLEITSPLPIETCSGVNLKINNATSFANKSVYLAFYMYPNDASKTALVSSGIVEVKLDSLGNGTGSLGPQILDQQDNPSCSIGNEYTVVAYPDSGKIDLDSPNSAFTCSNRQDFQTALPPTAVCKGGIALFKIDTALGCIPLASIALFVGAVFQLSIGIGGGISFLLIVIGAIQIIFSSGSPDSINSGKSLIFSAISGLIFLIFAVFMLRIIGVNIFQVIQ